MSTTYSVWSRLLVACGKRFAAVVNSVVKFCLLVLLLVMQAVLLAGVMLMVGAIVVLLTQATHAGGKSMSFDFGIAAFHDARMQEKQRAWGKRDRELTWAREDSEIQRRVADAQAAGVHPLFALGAQTQSSSAAIPVMGGSGGANFGAALQHMAREQAQETHDAALGESAARRRLLEAQADDIALRQFEASAAARAVQGSNSQQDLWKIEPDIKISPRTGEPEVTAGPDHPFWKEYRFGSGPDDVVDLPYSQEGPAESAENPFLWPFIFHRWMKQRLERSGKRGWTGMDYHRERVERMHRR